MSVATVIKGKLDRSPKGSIRSAVVLPGKGPAVPGYETGRGDRQRAGEGLRIISRRVLCFPGRAVVTGNDEAL